MKLIHSIKSYAKHLGFGIKTKNSRRSKVTGEFIDIKYVCTRHGKKKESTTNNPRPYLKIGCEAKLNVKRKQDEKWVVYDFVKEHNHDLFPNYSHYFPCHRSISLSQQSDISNLKAVGIKTSKVFEGCRDYVGMHYVCFTIQVCFTSLLIIF